MKTISTFLFPQGVLLGMLIFSWTLCPCFIKIREEGSSDQKVVECLSGLGFGRQRQVDLWGQVSLGRGEGHSEPHNSLPSPELKSETSTAEDVHTMMMLTSTTSMRGMPSLTRKQRGSTGSTQLRSSRTWREEQLCEPALGAQYRSWEGIRGFCWQIQTYTWDQFLYWSHLTLPPHRASEINVFSHLLFHMYMSTFLCLDRWCISCCEWLMFCKNLICINPNYYFSMYFKCA